MERNPPAFPLTTASDPISDGMTLRDYFAAKVAQGYVVSDSIPSPKDVAEYAYRVADALLEVRSKEVR